MSDPCERPHDPWYLPTRHLNALWSDLFPRLAARVWRGKATDPSWPAPGGDIRKWLRDQAKDFASAPLPPQTAGLVQRDCLSSISPGTNDGRSAAFKARMTDLAAYLDRGDSAPVFFHPGVVAYDFILSEEGVDLFRPPSPSGNTAEDEASLLGYYTFRSTGRTPIALGGVYTPFDLCGPEVEVLNPGANLTSTQGPSQVPALPGSAAGVYWSTSYVPAGKRVEVREEEWQDVTTFWCEHSSRCWQVSGTVARGIMVERPRVVAHIWQGLGFGRYNVRYIDPGNSGLRAIFCERLETSLPSQYRMRFEVGHPLPADPFYAGEDQRVVITDEGFFFPPIPDKRNLDDMLTEIVEGRAGNPVFTDSSRSA